MGSLSSASIIKSTMINAKLNLGVFLVVLLTSGSNCQAPGCPPDSTCPRYVVYDNWDYRLAYCSPYIPCYDSPFPTCVYNSGWQYWCFEKEDGKIVPRPVFTHLDPKFEEFRKSDANSYEYTNYTSSYSGTTQDFNDNNNDGPASGMVLYTKSVLGNTFVCSGINTTYNSRPRSDTFHGVQSSSVHSFYSDNNSPYVYKMTGYKGRGSSANFISGLTVDWTSGNSQGTIFCGPQNTNGLTSVDLTPPVGCGSCKLYQVAGEVDQNDGGFIRDLKLTWQCDL